MQQMIECLLAGQEEIKAKADADREQILAKMNATQAEQERMEADIQRDREDLKGIMA
jgi:hypothetical protein